MTVELTPLKNSWSLWAHLINEPGWELCNYTKISTISTVEDCIVLAKSIHPEFIKSCMLFFMIDDVTPRWEDEHNYQGGVFSFKIPNSSISRALEDLMFCLAARCLSSNQLFVNSITGLSVSPKKGQSFSIVKLWLNNSSFNNTTFINIPRNAYPLPFRGCFFIPHCESKQKDNMKKKLF